MASLSFIISLICSNSCPLSWWHYPTTSYSATPFFSCPQFFPASGCFPVSQFFPSGGQSIGASASASVLPMNIPLGLIGLICLQAIVKTLNSLPQHHNLKASLLQHSAFFMAQLSHPYMTTGKTIALTRWTFVDKGFPGGSVDKELACNAGDARDMGSVPRSGRSPGGGHRGYW